MIVVYGLHGKELLNYVNRRKLFITLDAIIKLPCLTGKLGYTLPIALGIILPTVNAHNL